MPREKFKTLTQQMYYILLCLGEECCGIDIMDRVAKHRGGGNPCGCSLAPSQQQNRP